MGINNRLVYLAGPIDFVINRHANDWRTNAKGILKRHGYGCYDPSAAFANVERTVNGQQVMDINAAAVGSCGIILARLDAFTVGTCREIEMATRVGKFVFIWSPDKAARDDLKKSISTADCVILDENFLGDAIQLMVNHIKKEEEWYESQLDAMVLEEPQIALFRGNGEPESEEDDPS